jgi:hypothetical protein
MSKDLDVTLSRLFDSAVVIDEVGDLAMSMDEA